MMSTDPILFYDSDCGFCNGVVRFVMRYEKTPVLRFAPVKGQTAAAMAIPPDVGAKTLVLTEGGRQLIRSRAVWRIMDHMGGGWQTAAMVLRWIPAPLADVGYRLVAKIRKSLPAGESCELLPAEVRWRFLD